MKRTACLILFVLLNLPGRVFSQEPVYFADSNLKAAVEDALGISDPTPDDMLGLFFFDASNRGIVDLTGLEYATNLLELGLANNEINDITPLSGLTSILWLDLEYNQIRGISGLSGLTNVTSLFLNDNQISDISALSEFYFLFLLDLRHNPLNQDAHEIYIPLIYDNNILLHPFWWPIDYDPPSIGNYELTIDSTVGGSVTTPGEGSFYYYDQESIVTIRATLEPHNRFMNWTGTAVDAGQVANPNSAVTTVSVDDNYTLRANFVPGNNLPDVPILLLPADGAATLTTPAFQLLSTDIDGDPLGFKIEVLKNNQVVRSFDQTQDVTNWDRAEYPSSEVATFTVHETQALVNGAYQWRAYAYDGEQWSVVSETWSFNVTTELDQLETAHFIISYTTNTLIPWHVENNAYAERVAQYMEDAYEFFVEEHGFNAGWSENSEKYKVSIGGFHIWSLGAYGELRADAWKIRGEPLGTYSVIKHDLNNALLRMTCFHEYFHAIQHAYHRYLANMWIPYFKAKLWIIEGNARAMEYIAPGYPTDFSDEMGSTATGLFLFENSTRDYFQNTHRTLIDLSYDAGLYWYFLMRNTKIEFDGNTQLDTNNNIENLSVISTLWEKLHELSTYDSWDYDEVKTAINAALVNAEPQQYRNFDASFVAFAKANFIAITYPVNSQEQFYLPDAINSIEGQANFVNTLEDIDLRSFQNPVIRNVENYGVRYFKITNANQGDQIQISFNGDDKSVFFVKIYPAGDINREDTINNWDIITLPEDDVINTAVIVGRLDDNDGNGDFTITFSCIPQ